MRGYYRFSRELGGLYVANCANPIMIDGVQRAAAVYVLPRAKSQEGIAEEEEFAKAVKSLIKSGRPDAISVVFLGRLRASAGPSIVDSIGNKRKPARMFGHLGVYPAEMEVERTLDIKILNDPNHAANMSNLKPEPEMSCLVPRKSSAFLFHWPNCGQWIPDRSGNIPVTRSTWCYRAVCPKR